MPRRCAPMKDAARRRYAWGSRVQAVIPRSPNGATRPFRRTPPMAEGTGGTETSQYPEEEKASP